MIARLRAMYQGSKKMLIFLAVIFLAINIVCGVMLAMGFEHIVGGKLYYDGSNNHAHCVIFRRTPPLWHLWVHIQLRAWRPTADHNGLDSQHGMGDPCIVSCYLDCYKTLPRTARAIDSMYRRGLFHRVNQNSCAVFCNVSWHFEYCGYLLIPWHFACASFVAASCLHIGFLSRKISVRSSIIDILTRVVHYFYRIRGLWELRHIMAFFTFAQSCRSFYWGHVSSLAFENITLSFRPTAMQEQTLLRWSFRSVCMYQLAMVCSEELMLGGFFLAGAE